MMLMRGSSRRLRREEKEGGRCSFREESGKEEKERLASSLRLPLRADNAPTVSVSAGGRPVIRAGVMCSGRCQNSRRAFEAACPSRINWE